MSYAIFWVLSALYLWLQRDEIRATFKDRKVKREFKRELAAFERIE